MNSETRATQRFFRSYPSFLQTAVMYGLYSNASTQVALFTASSPFVSFLQTVVVYGLYSNASTQVALFIAFSPFVSFLQTAVMYGLLF